MRTSFGALALGIGFQALFGEMQPTWLPRAIATTFLLLAIFLIFQAERRAAAVMARMNAHVIITAKPLNLRLFAAVIAAASVALIAAIWLAN